MNANILIVLSFARVNHHTDMDIVLSGNRSQLRHYVVLHVEFLIPLPLTRKQELQRVDHYESNAISFNRIGYCPQNTIHIV